MISRTSKMARTFYIVAYLLFLLAGVVAFFAPSRILSQPLVGLLVYGWATFLTVGSFLCLLGKFRGNWAGEIVGLPLLGVSSWIFGVLLFFEGTSPAAFAVGGIFCGMATLFGGRWTELMKLAKANQGVNSDGP
jgi:hypothetical protein